MILLPKVEAAPSRENPAASYNLTAAIFLSSTSLDLSANVNSIHWKND